MLEVRRPGVCANTEQISVFCAATDTNERGRGGLDDGRAHSRRLSSSIDIEAAGLEKGSERLGILLGTE